MPNGPQNLEFSMKQCFPKGNEPQNHAFSKKYSNVLIENASNSYPFPETVRNAGGVEGEVVRWLSAVAERENESFL